MDFGRSLPQEDAENSDRHSRGQCKLVERSRQDMRVHISADTDVQWERLLQGDAEDFERHRSPERVRAAADAAGMSSPWIERELRALRTMCENNKRDNAQAQVCTSHLMVFPCHREPGA